MFDRFFEMLTGERPFRGSLRMLLKQVIEDDPPTVGRLDGAVPRDLETICLKCLEKTPDRRYDTVGPTYALEVWPAASDGLWVREKKPPSNARTVIMIVKVDYD